MIMRWWSLVVFPCEPQQSFVLNVSFKRTISCSRLICERFATLGYRRKKKHVNMRKTWHEAFTLTKTRRWSIRSMLHLVHRAIRVVCSSGSNSAFRQRWDYMVVLWIDRDDRLQYTESDLEPGNKSYRPRLKVLKEISRTHTKQGSCPGYQTSSQTFWNGLKRFLGGGATKAKRTALPAAVWWT